jgi:gas vesicle protein
MANQGQDNALLYGGLIAGALLGAGIGLAITPRTGEQNRRFLELRARRLGRDVRHGVIETTATAQEFVGAKASQMQQAVTSAADNVKATASDVTTSARNAVVATGENVRQATATAADAVRQKADDVRQATGAAVSNVQQAAGDAVSNVQQAASDAASSVKAKVDEVRGVAATEANPPAQEPTVIVVSDNHSHRGEYSQ